MYNVNQTIDSEARASNFLDVGIHEDVTLNSAEYKVSDAGNEFLVFHFERDGKKIDHTEWKPNDADPQKLENKELNQIKRVKHIVTKFIPEDQYVFQASDFKSFCENTVKLLGNAYVGKLVRLKVIYNFNNYTSLPNYVPFIETMEVPKAESKLETLSIDKMTKDRADAEPQTTNPVADLAEPTIPEVQGTSPTDELPLIEELSF